MLAVRDRLLRDVSCISALEAQAAGCVCVASDWGAISETVDFGLTVPKLDAPGKKWRSQFVADLVEGLTSEQVQRLSQKDGPTWAAKHDWDGVGLLVEQLLAEPTGPERTLRGFREPLYARLAAIGPDLPRGPMKYPRPVEQVHQIEVTSHCNLRCVYCPSRDLDKPLHDVAGELLPLAVDGGTGGFGREKEDMTIEVFERALEHVVHYAEAGTQGELALTGIGEALMHPDFILMAELARAALPENLITLSTNGVLLAHKAGHREHLRGELLIDALHEYRIATFVSMHRPERAAIAANRLRERGVLMAQNTAFGDMGSMDWAGGLDWQVNAEPITCEFLRSGWCVILADGRIATCCLDAEGSSTVGHVDDAPGTHVIQPWKGERQGCSSCYQEVP